MIQHPICELHDARIKFICQQPKCRENALNCGECLYEFHADHCSKVLKTEDMLKDVQSQLKSIIDDNTFHTEVTDCVALMKNDKSADEIRQKLTKNLESHVTKIDAIMSVGLKEKAVELEEINPEKLKSLIESFSYGNQGLAELKKNIISLAKCNVALQDLTSQAPALMDNSQKMISQISEHSHSYSQNIDALTEKFEQNVNLMLASSLLGGSISLWEYKFNPQQLKTFSLSDDCLKLTCNGGCDQDKKAFSDQEIPQNGQVFWEIKREHTSGCYDSIGVSTVGTMFQERNGMNDKGWAMRLHGGNTSTSFTGYIHNNAFQNCFTAWQDDDKLGMLYDSNTTSLSYFRNGTYLGTPFKNVKGEKLYFLVEGCHLGGFSVVQDSELPSQEELDRIESPAQPVYNY